MIRPYTIAGWLVALVLSTSATAGAERIKYSGIHPIPDAVDGEFCHIEFPHVHVYEPEKVKVLYRVDDGHHHFVGDPVAFGYEGDRHAYYGHHPVVVDASVHIDVVEPATEYCYINGPHYHSYEPPPGLTFESKGDAYWYIGPFPRPYHKRRKQLARINVVYEPIEYERPVVVVEAPPAGYRGPVIEVRGPAVEIEVPRPGATLEVTVPSLDVHVGVPGVVVEHRRHKRHKRHKKFKKYKKHKKHKKFRRHKRKHRH